MRGSGLPGVSDSRVEGGFDEDSPMGKLESMARQAEEAGAGVQVESLAPDLIKPFVPESLAGMKRTEISAERNNTMGMQVSEARGTYADDAGRSLRLEIIDMGGMMGMMAFAGWAAGEQ